MLQALELPVIATGPMRIDTRIKDAGRLRQLDFKAKLGDLDASVRGTLKSRNLIGSDLKFEATAADAARLASVFDVNGVPAAPLTVSGHTVQSRKEIKFDVADRSHCRCFRACGWQHAVHGRPEDSRCVFELAAASLAKLREAWPQMEVSASGAFESAKGRIEAERSASRLWARLSWQVRCCINAANHIEAQLSSPRLDLTPFFPPNSQAQASAANRRPPQPSAEEEVHVQRDAAAPRQDEGHRCEAASGLRRTGARRSVYQGPRQQLCTWITER